MAEIKTREKRQGIKVLDRTAEIGGQVREKARRMKDTGAQLTDDRQESPNDYAAERVQEGGRQLAGNAADLLVRQGKKLVRSARGKLNRSDGEESFSESDDSGEGVCSPEPETKPAETPEQDGASIEPHPEPYNEPAPVQPESDFQQVSREYPSPSYELPDDDFGIKTRSAAHSQLLPDQRSAASEPEEISPRIKTRDSVGAPVNSAQQSVKGHSLSEPISANKTAVLPRYTAQEAPASEADVSEPTPLNHSSQSDFPCRDKMLYVFIT